jgi:plastocyanin
VHTPAAKKACKQRQAAKKKNKKRTQPSQPAKPKPGRDTPATSQPAPRTETPTSGGDPKPTATPTPKPGATATPTPTATPVATATPPPLPSRTNVDLTDIREWSVRPSYRALAAGRIDFNVNNRGEDDHNLTVRDAARDLGKIDLAPGETGTLTVQLTAGSYTLYCSLPAHEAAGMSAVISVR